MRRVPRRVWQGTTSGCPEDCAAGRRPKGSLWSSVPSVLQPSTESRTPEPKANGKTPSQDTTHNSFLISFSIASGFCAPIFLAATFPSRSMKYAIGSPSTPPYCSPVEAVPITTG